MDSVGSNDMQQSDMNHAPPPPDTHPWCAEAHSQKASDTIKR